jgi:hypothetical protein
MGIPVGWSPKSSSSKEGVHRESFRSAVDRVACVALVGVPRPPDMVTATVCVASAAVTVSGVSWPRGTGLTGGGTYVLVTVGERDRVRDPERSQKSAYARVASVGR